MHSDFYTANDFLTKIYRDNAYLHIVLKENTNKRVKKLVMGVLEKHYELHYIADTLADKPIKSNCKTLFLLATYAFRHMNEPKNAVIKELTEALDEAGKGALKGFSVAYVNKLDGWTFCLPPKSDKRYAEVKYNLPAWLVGMYKKEFPDTFEAIINAKEYPFTHVRLGKNTTEEDLKKACHDAVKTEVGYFVKKNKETDLMSFLGKITYMGYTSALVAEAVHPEKGQTVLDCCAAPGGKAVALAQKGALVTACDVHPHRVDLIRDYAERMKVGIDVFVSDATVHNAKWREKFDIVLADVPCSGFGVIGKKRDVVLNRTYDDLLRLSALQDDILENVSRYVKPGGVLVYSTCTVFSKENGDVTGAFLHRHPEFKKEKIDLPMANDGEIRFLPDGKGTEGFYVCRMRKA